MAAWQEEVDGKAWLARKLLGQNWLIFEQEDGTYAMVQDRCPHRFAPLSMGKRVGDTIACGYHGLRFDGKGQCVHNPFSDMIPPAAKLATYPVVARHGILWFWPGEAEAADPATIPDFTILDDPRPMVRQSMRMQAHYELLTDNLMDLSHVEFVHENTFNSGGVFWLGQHHAFQDEQGAIWSNWAVEDVPPPPFVPQLKGRNCNRWTKMRWNAPATMMLEVGCAPHDAPQDTSAFPTMRNPHIVTPESENSSWYFYNCEPGEESIAFARKVFEDEDQPMLEAVQQAMDGQDFWDMRPVVLNIDGGAIRARRHLEKMKKAEAAPLS
ncbi:aromatic ring-hydroxylating dioxygenase subunit alpha [Novosphingobium umbonatum]|nr:aromatic ring-hydroxylating dioxygenase subunit alpha [Novosphingobium umbonatum]